MLRALGQAEFRGGLPQPTFYEVLGLGYVGKGLGFKVQGLRV